MPHKTPACSPAQNFSVCRSPKPDTRTFPCVVNGETLAGWGVIAGSPHGRIDIMFGPVITTEAHPAFSGDRTHSSNTAEMTAMIEAFSFLGPRGPVARDTNSCIIYDSKHAAGVCLGTIQARTHVQLAVSTVDAKRPAQVTTYHAARSRTCWEFV